MQNSPPGASFAPKMPLKKMILFFVGIIILVVGAILLWTYYLSPSARESRRIEQQYQQYTDWKDFYESAMRADIYGGSTPQETLDLFISALEKEDVELASKYFWLEEDGKPDQMWVDGLQQAKSEGRLEEIISIIKKSIPSERNTGSEDTHEFIVKNTNNEVERSIILKFNTYSNIWKIESL